MTRAALHGRLVGVLHAARTHRTELSLAVLRMLAVALSLTTLETTPGLDAPGAGTAHLLLLGLTVASILALPAVARAGRQEVLGVALTVATLAFYVGYTAVFADVAGAGTSVGLLALLEAPIRYGTRGLLLSVPPVVITALALPQQDASGNAPSPVTVVVLVAVLCAATIVIRNAHERSGAALQTAQERLAEALLHLPIGVAVVDEDGTVLQANAALAALQGERAAPPVGRPLAAALPAACQELPDPLPTLALQVPAQRSVYETADGRWLSVGSSPLRLGGSGPCHAVVHVQDVTAQRRERADLLHVARHDALTGLLTRAAGTEVLQDALRSHDATAVLFLDLDDFKQLNDTAGHAAGDAVLRRAAARVRGALRPSEAAVRWGGDEIVVVCRDVADDGQLTAVATRLLQALQEPFTVDEVGPLTVTASIGGTRTVPTMTADAAVRAADEAMYVAKRRGGNRFTVAERPLAGTSQAG